MRFTQRIIPSSLPLGVNWSSPYARGLIDAFIALQTQSMVLRVPKNTSSTGTGAVGIGGAGVISAGGGVRHDFDDARLRPQGDWTLLHVFSMDASGLVNFNGTAGVASMVATDGGAGFVASGAAQRLRAFNATNSNVNGTRSYVAGLNVEILRIKSAAKLGALWLNGLQSAADTAIANYIPPTVRGPRFGDQPGANSTSSAGLKYHFMALWGRALADSECVALSRAPYMVLRTRRAVEFPPEEGAAAAFRARPYYDMTTHHGISGAGV